MDFALILLIVVAAWQVLRVRHQRANISLLGRHLADLNLERHMETLTQGYTRAIHEENESRQLQVLETFAPTERAVAAQMQTLATSIQKDDAQRTRMGTYPICVPYATHLLPASTQRDFRTLLQVHANGLRRAVDNEAGWPPKTRAFHLSAELYLFQHSCHWFCKSRNVADARLMLRHQVTHKKVLESVSEPTRKAYLEWLRGR
mgnify:FL=1